MPALAAGAAQDEAAAGAGVGDRTIRRWLSRPEFVALVDAELEVYVEATRRAYVERYRRRLDAPPRRRATPARPAAPAPRSAKRSGEVVSVGLAALVRYPLDHPHEFSGPGGMAVGLIE